VQFKSFAQRVSSVDVDVFRSLVPVKFEPTAGSSFFHENLLQWRVSSNDQKKLQLAYWLALQKQSGWTPLFDPRSGFQDSTTTISSSKLYAIFITSYDR
jgi:hypothetical protein